MNDLNADLYTQDFTLPHHIVAAWRASRPPFTTLTSSRPDATIPTASRHTSTTFPAIREPRTMLRSRSDIPVQSSSPSSPPPLLSSSRLEFDLRIASAHAEQARNFAAQVKARDLRILADDLTWRKQQIQSTDSAKYWRQPYRLLRPWPLEMRLRCTQFPELLADYYESECWIEERLSSGLQYYGQEAAAWVLCTEEGQRELRMLRHAEGLRTADFEARNDAIVLHWLLEQLEEEIDELANKGADEAEERTRPEQLVTDLPSALRWAIDKDSMVLAHWTALKAKEVELFPFRYEMLEGEKRDSVEYDENAMSGLIPGPNSPAESMMEGGIELPDNSTERYKQSYSDKLADITTEEFYNGELADYSRWYG